MTMQPMTDNQVQQTLKDIIEGLNTSKAKIQVVIEAGLLQVQESGNTIYLSAVLNACVGTKALPTNTIKKYIQEHCTNLKWGKDKAGNFVFSKAMKGKDNPCVVTEPTKPWFEYTKPDQAKPDVDAVARAKALLTNITKALEEHHIKDEEQAMRIKSALETVLAA